MTKEKLFPELRFSEFNDNWNRKKYGELYSFQSTNSYSRENLNYESGKVKNIHYGDIHTKFDSLFDVTKEIVPFINGEIDISKFSKDNYLVEGDLVVADASEDYADIGKTIEIYNTNEEKIVAGLHCFHAKRISEIIVIGFSSFLMKTQKVRLEIMRIAQGTKVLGISTTRLKDIELIIPIKEEQQKITTFLIAIDKRLQFLEEKKRLLERYKQGIVQKLFPKNGERLPEIRFKDENGKNFPKWEVRKLSEVLEYEQPTKYLVTSNEYKDEYDIPVLTAGKTFLLGYTNEVTGVFKENLPTIIFDDFTTAFQFVDFPFKAKSSAMKMLIPKNADVNVNFVFEAMKIIKFMPTDHKRYWISEYQFESIPYPSKDEQKKISDFIGSVDKKKSIVQFQIDEMKKFKKGILQKMFI